MIIADKNQMPIICQRLECLQGHLALQNEELARAAYNSDELLKDITIRTAQAAKERTRVAGIVAHVTSKAQVWAHYYVKTCDTWLLMLAI